MSDCPGLVLYRAFETGFSVRKRRLCIPTTVRFCSQTCASVNSWRYADSPFRRARCASEPHRVKIDAACREKQRTYRSQFETVGIFAQEKKAVACFCNRCVLSVLHWHFSFPGRMSGIWNLRVRVTKFRLYATHSGHFQLLTFIFEFLREFNSWRAARLECLLSDVVRSD
jgi:hypothetical protein